VSFPVANFCGFYNSFLIKQFLAEKSQFGGESSCNSLPQFMFPLPKDLLVI
jgi:hypothetical protein